MKQCHTRGRENSPELWALPGGEGERFLQTHFRSKSFQLIGHNLMKTESRTGGQRAFTLIEIMVVVVILGILAATIIPQFVGTTHDAKVSAAKSHIAELESALERFNVHMDRYPTTDEGLKALVETPANDDKRWRGPYVKQLRLDPWGSPYEYRAPGVHHRSSFDLWSRGADKADGGEGEGADIGNW